MSAVRIIPRLDIKGPNVVKGIHLEGLRVLGDPSAFARHYYESGADELFYMDVVASLYGRNSLEEIISKTAKDVFIPITVGGGLRNLSDFHRVLHAGADRFCINTAAIKNPALIREASLQFGTSTVVVAIEAIRQSDGRYFAFIDNGREQTGVEVTAWARKVQELGAGEIVITSVDREGTGAGFDVDLIRSLTSFLDIPVIAHGGAGNAHDPVLAVQAGASAVALASVLHYDFTSAFSNKKITPAGLAQIKSQLKESGIECR
jgi:cyclase